MKKKNLVFSMMLLILGFAVSSQAALHNNGGGLIYDDVLDVTWLADANYAVTSGYDEDGLMSFFDAIDWVKTLDYAGYDNWVLPEVTAGCTGFGCNDSNSELGYMFYVNLEGTAGTDISTSTDPDLALFDILSGQYWTMTSFPQNQNYAFDFDLSNGEQGLSPKYGGEAYVWAVAKGNIAAPPPPVVPEPISTILFVTGGMVLGGKRYFKRKKTGN